MDHELSEQLDALAKKAGAIITCRSCCSNEISAGDEEANQRAHVMAQQAFKAGQLRANSAAEVSSQMARTLESANLDCPQCE